MTKNYRQTKLACALFLLLFCLTSSGCWDRRELQERAFVLAVGIDTGDAGQKPGQTIDAAHLETFTAPSNTGHYRVSIQVLNLAPQKDSNLKKKATKTYVISATGNSLFEIIRDMPGQTNKALWWEHVQAIVLSEAVLRQDNLKTLLDFFLRDSEMRSRIKLFVTPGEARPIIEYQPKSGDAGGIYLVQMSRNTTNNTHIIYHSDLGFVNETLATDSDAFIPRLELTNKVLKMGGSGAFKQGQFVGYLDEYATMGMKIIRGAERNAVLTITSPNQPQNLLVLQSYRHDTRLKPHIDGENIYFTLDVSMIGYVDELQGDNVQKEFDTSKPEDIRKLELLFADEIKQAAQYGWQQAQALNLANIHYLHLDAKIRQQNPALWNQVKDNWYTEFSAKPLTVSANVTIKGIGKHK